MVKSGTTQAEVQLEGDGMVVGWQRSEKVNRYTLNGQIYDKVGRSVPDPIMDALEIRPLEYDGETVRLQWAPQMSGPFLIGDSGARATRMLGSAGNVAIVGQAAKLAAAEVKAQNDVVTATQALLTKVEADLASLQWVEDAAPLAAALQAADQRSAAARQKVITVQEQVARWQHARKRLQNIGAELAGARSCRTKAEVVAAMAEARNILVAYQTAERAFRKAVMRRTMAEQARAAAARQKRAVEKRIAWEHLHSLQARRDTVRQSLVTARVERDRQQVAYTTLVASLTCPTCGQIQSAA